MIRGRHVDNCVVDLFTHIPKFFGASEFGGPVSCSDCCGEDLYELNILVGLYGMTAANSTIIQAEHMRCLLVDWMTRLDSSVGYYSDPAANYGQGKGDISEIRNRQSWTANDFWTSASDSGVMEMGKVAWTGDAYIRHDWLYMGARISEQTTEVSSMTFSGQDANLCSFDASTPSEFGHKACIPIRIHFLLLPPYPPLR
jgi:hypothetical protein